MLSGLIPAATAGTGRRDLRHDVVDELVLDVRRGRGCRRMRCPVVMLVPGGAQNLNLLKLVMEPYADPLVARGVTVIGVAVPARSEPLYRDVARLSHAMDWISVTLAPPEGVDVVGFSNGGLAAMALAVAHPEGHRQTTVLPGFLPDAAFEDAGQISHPVRLVVGTGDAWMEPVALTQERLLRANVQVSLVKISDTGHRLDRAVTADRLLEWLDLRSIR